MNLTNCVKVLEKNLTYLQGLYDNYKRTNVQGYEPVKEWDEEIEALTQAISILKRIDSKEMEEIIVKIFSISLDEMKMAELKSNPSYNYIGLAYKLAGKVEEYLKA